MTITVELEADVLDALRAEAKAQSRDVESIAADAVRQRYAVAQNEPGKQIYATLDDELAVVLGLVWAGISSGKDASRLSEVEAACDPLPGE